MYSPVTESEGVTRKSLTSRIETVSNARVGLFDNGKRAAQPILNVVEERLESAYESVSVEYYAVDHMNMLKNEAERDRVASWAKNDVDACIGAIGDCGSCTKFLVYALDSVESAGTPAVGLLDEGFVLDWESNAADFGRELRYYTLPTIAEITDQDRIRRVVTPTVVENIVAELTEPLSASERGQDAAVVSEASTTDE